MRRGSQDDGGRNAAFGREHHNGGTIELGGESGQKTQAIHPGHHQVCDNDSRTEALNARKTFDAIRRHLGLISPAAHELGQTLSGARFVVDDENACDQHSVITIRRDDFHVATCLTLLLLQTDL